MTQEVRAPRYAEKKRSPAQPEKQQPVEEVKKTATKTKNPAPAAKFTKPAEDKKKMTNSKPTKGKK